MRLACITVSCLGLFLLTALVGCGSGDSAPTNPPPGQAAGVAATSPAAPGAAAAPHVPGARPTALAGSTMVQNSASGNYTDGDENDPYEEERSRMNLNPNAAPQVGSAPRSAPAYAAAGAVTEEEEDEENRAQRRLRHQMTRQSQPQPQRGGMAGRLRGSLANIPLTPGVQAGGANGNYTDGDENDPFEDDRRSLNTRQPMGRNSGARGQAGARGPAAAQRAIDPDMRRQIAADAAAAKNDAEKEGGEAAKEPAAETPEQIIRSFLDAVASEDKEMMARCMSQRAIGRAERIREKTMTPEDFNLVTDRVGGGEIYGPPEQVRTNEQVVTLTVPVPEGKAKRALVTVTNELGKWKILRF